MNIDFNLKTLTVLFCLVVFLVLYLSKEFLVTDDFYYNSFGEQMSFESISNLISSNKKWWWIFYPITITVYVIKISLVTICLSIGLLLGNFKIKLKTLVQVVLVGEFIFFVPLIIKIFWFYFNHDSYTLDDLQNFYPLSVINLFDRNQLDVWQVYPLSLVNFFEIFYLLYLSYSIHKLTGTKFFKSFKIISLSYCSTLLIWILFITFLTVSLSS